MSAPFRIGGLAPRDRDRTAAILQATGVFRPDEIDVALEVFDAGLGTGDSGLATARGGTVPAPEAVTSPESRVPSPGSSISSDYLFLGAFTPEDELVGYVCYGPTPGTDRTFDLYWIVVDPARHGAGIGTTLLTEVERRLTGQHARLLVVETSSRSDYAPTRTFYRRRGYTEAARVREFYAPGDDRIIFTKRIHPLAHRAGSVDRHE